MLFADSVRCVTLRTRCTWLYPEKAYVQSRLKDLVRYKPLETIASAP